MTKTLTLMFGTILALTGLLGFVSNPLIGANALFAADAAHNAVHLILGAILLVAAVRSGSRAGVALRTVGALLFLLGLIGLLAVPAAGGSLLGIAYTNGTMNWFNLIIGAVAFFSPLYVNDEPAFSPAG